MMKRLLIGLLALAALAACDRPNPMSSLSKPNMTALSPKLQKLFEKTRPVCFGRFVIDVPAGAEIAWGPAHVDYPIVSYSGQADKIPVEIKAKLDAYAAEKHMTEPSMLVEVRDGPNPESKIIVGYTDRLDDIFVEINAYLRLPPHAFVMTEKDISTGEWRDVVTEFTDVTSRLRVRADDEIPSEPGLCIESGFVAETEGKYHEHFSIGFRILPDVHMSILAIKKTRAIESDSLEYFEKSFDKGRKDAQRLGAGTDYARIQWLRKGRRVLIDQPAFEAGARYPASKASSHEFVLRTLPELNNPFKPRFDITLDTGAVGDQPGKTAPSLTDEEVVALWDKLLGSIRPRPATPPKAAEPIPPRPDGSAGLPLGTQVSSRYSCPQSGVWECAADVPIDGPKQRFIEAFQPLPHGFAIEPAAGLKGKLGAKRRETREITWTLVAYEETEK